MEGLDGKLFTENLYRSTNLTKKYKLAATNENNNQTEKHSHRLHI